MKLPGKAAAELLYPSVYPKALAARGWYWDDGKVVGGVSEHPLPSCLVSTSSTGAGNRGGLHSYPTGLSKSWHFHAPLKPGYVPRKTRNMQAVQDTLDPQKSSWLNCLQRTHTFFQGSGFSPPKDISSLFIIFKIWPVALAPDTTVARSPRVPWTMDHCG
ncbi:hypothetical protein HJG60_010566 [Phyllostomus discolor]|uniref:Uncharacterized protein n=1 Tax=Phyllostomus discolor TaxID=89673 RepID=A0A834ARJ6_9CHIR|nr:hypothetical protein HJG60_010566 [Phyllostomus discolor]